MWTKVGRVEGEMSKEWSGERNGYCVRERERERERE
jgi:hypothetical protein